MTLFSVIKKTLDTDGPWCDVAIEICKMTLLDNLNQILTNCKVLDDYIFDTLKYFCQTNEYNDNGLLLQTALEGVVGEDEFRASNSQLNFYINYLKFPMSSLKETLISCSERSEVLNTKFRESSCAWMI